jgi:hypothetical protein
MSTKKKTITANVVKLKERFMGPPVFAPELNAQKSSWSTLIYIHELTFIHLRRVSRKRASAPLSVVRVKRLL